MSSTEAPTTESRPIPTSSYTLNQIEESRRPTEEVACMNCPLAVWMAMDKTVVCYCRTLYMYTWETGKPGKIRICDAPEQVKKEAEEA